MSRHWLRGPQCDFSKARRGRCRCCSRSAGVQQLSGRQHQSERTGVRDDRHPAAGVGGDVHPLDLLRPDGAVGLGVDPAVGVQRRTAARTRKSRTTSCSTRMRRRRGTTSIHGPATPRSRWPTTRRPTRTPTTGASRSCSTPGRSRSSRICGDRRPTPTRSSRRFVSRSTSRSRRSTTASSRTSIRPSRCSAPRPPRLGSRRRTTSSSPAT